jgi:ubiquinone/menaquinone biosynthesis C-methylase UbiE/GNAT superfamily N-acetyltransferase
MFKTIITIRNMAAADRDAVISIHRQSIFGMCKDHYAVQEMKAWTDRLTPELFDEGMKDENNVGVVAVAANIVIGYGFFSVSDRELRALYVLPQYAGQGAGRLIMFRLEDMAREKGLRRLSLQSTVNAVEFYQKLGYQKIKAEMHQINDEVSIACVRMEKNLDIERLNLSGYQDKKGYIMSEQQDIKTVLRQTFDAVSSGYDGKALRFFPESAQHMASILGLRGDEHVLDVACGTGHATLAIAPKLPKGRITAVDLSPGMLDQARRKTEAKSFRNVEFLERDMQELGFTAATFDVAVCAFGIFFVEDMDAQLAHIASMVKPGGRVMITSFVENYFQPLRDRLFGALSAYGVQNPPQTWKGVASEAGCRQLFETAGLTNIGVVEKNVGYYLESSDEWWDIVWNAGFRRLLAQLSSQDQERFKREHLEEVGALRADKGIWLDVGVLYTVGTKA